MEKGGGQGDQRESEQGRGEKRRWIKMERRRWRNEVDWEEMDKEIVDKESLEKETWIIWL